MGLKSDTFTKLTKQDVVSGKDGTPSDSMPFLSSFGDAIVSVKDETDQESVAEQGVYYPPTSCYNYYYPGYNGTSNMQFPRGAADHDLWHEYDGGSTAGCDPDNGGFEVF